MPFILKTAFVHEKFLAGMLPKAATHKVTKNTNKCNLLQLICLPPFWRVAKTKQVFDLFCKFRVFSGLKTFYRFIPNSSLEKTCHSRESGNPDDRGIPREAGQHHGFVSFAGVISCWIPAFAGMTELMDYLGSF